MHQTIAQKPGPCQGWPGPRQGWYVVGICTLAYIFSFIDRQILSLLVGPIKLDLGLTDTSFAFLHGFAFSIFYATLGVPIAGLADRMARPLVIAGGIALWSLATAACGLASGFSELLLARMMVGAGEAALSPAAYALINDLFPREKLGRAIGVYSLGSFLGAGLALLVGGALVAMAGSNSAVMVGAWSLRVWQMCFLVVGLPGLLLAALVWLTVREPAARKGGGQEGAPPPLRAVLGYLVRERAIFAPHMLGYAFSGWALFGMLAWGPAALMRGFGLNAQEAGLRLGIVAILAGGGGAFASGWLLDRFARLGRADTTFLVGIAGGLGSALASVALALAGSPTGAIVALTGLQFFSSFAITPSSALTQMVAPPAMRARIAALLICGTGFVGAGLGPLLIGLLNDHATGNAALSLALVCGAGGILSASLLAKGCAPMRTRGQAT